MHYKTNGPTCALRALFPKAFGNSCGIYVNASPNVDTGLLMHRPYTIYAVDYFRVVACQHRRYSKSVVLSHITELKQSSIRITSEVSLEIFARFALS
jgi:hypothetical protein